MENVGTSHSNDRPARSFQSFGKRRWTTLVAAVTVLAVLGSVAAGAMRSGSSPQPTALSPTATASDHAVTATATAARRPSIVLILTDDQRWDTLWAMGHVQEVLKQHGVTFKNAFVTNSLCCPSRTTILTGKYSHSTGVYSNAPPHGGVSVLPRPNDDRDRPARRRIQDRPDRQVPQRIQGRRTCGLRATGLGPLVRFRRGQRALLQLRRHRQREDPTLRLAPGRLLHERPGQPSGRLHPEHQGPAVPVLHPVGSPSPCHPGATGQDGLQRPPVRVAPELQRAGCLRQAHVGPYRAATASGLCGVEPTPSVPNASRRRPCGCSDRSGAA
jgi:hypothetical protein